MTTWIVMSGLSWQCGRHEDDWMEPIDEVHCMWCPRPKDQRLPKRASCFMNFKVNVCSALYGICFLSVGAAFGYAGYFLAKDIHIAASNEVEGYIRNEVHFQAMERIPLAMDCQLLQLGTTTSWPPCTEQTLQRVIDGNETQLQCFQENSMCTLTHDSSTIAKGFRSKATVKWWTESTACAWNTSSFVSNGPWYLPRNLSQLAAIPHAQVELYCGVGKRPSVTQPCSIKGMAANHFMQNTPCDPNILTGEQWPPLNNGVSNFAAIPRAAAAFQCFLYVITCVNYTALFACGIPARRWTAITCCGAQRQENEEEPNKKETSSEEIAIEMTGMPPEEQPPIPI